MKVDFSKEDLAILSRAVGLLEASMARASFKAQTTDMKVAIVKYCDEIAAVKRKVLSGPFGP